MKEAMYSKDRSVLSYLEKFSFNPSLFEEQNSQAKTRIDSLSINNKEYPRFTNEYWTSQQRQSNAIHEISYRACFKAQLPRFFIEILTKKGETVYDPFAGRGTTAIESAILGRNVIANDINPLTAVFILPRLNIPDINSIAARLQHIPPTETEDEFDLSMFYHKKTLQEIRSLRNYLRRRKESGKEDEVDSWIRMVATNRLTGHSPGFFSGYTLPPNQAISREGQAKINKKRNRRPPYRDTNAIMLRKTKTLLADMTPQLRAELKRIAANAKVITADARQTGLEESSVNLTVTSPPFLDIVDYPSDNWLRCWFNDLRVEEIAPQITMRRSVSAWAEFMLGVFKELFRITEPMGWVACEVGEVRNGKVRLDEVVIPLGEQAGFKCHGVVVNLQNFTKTANIWGVSNNKRGTNTNRIVLFEKL